MTIFEKAIQKSTPYPGRRGWPAETGNGIAPGEWWPRQKGRADCEVLLTGEEPVA